VQNTVTGLTLRDGPVNFSQTTYFDPATQTRELISISGVSVNVRRGNEHLLDAVRASSFSADRLHLLAGSDFGRGGPVRCARSSASPAGGRSR
jgi:hypothetical protein